MLHREKVNTEGTLGNWFRTYFAIALAEVVQIECDGKWVGELSEFCPGMLCKKG